MKILPRSHKDEDQQPIFGLHWGDLGVVVIAALCTLALILILILPSPVARYEKAQAERNRTQKQTATAKAPSQTSGEVSVGILPEKRH